MPNISVTKRGKKWVVLVNFIQVGIPYSSKEYAEVEAKRIKDKKMW
ncbi:MAG: hypothetical protein JSV32_06480 [Dehalococcoidia bacterium]|nr:MAG: hypothetical protein JSV32_06480 [Dehalococcoidia bacterium]